MADVLTREQRRKAMQHIRSKDTSIELLLRRELWKTGIRYRKNYNALPGKPDIAITKYRIAVFCDSEFFHGKNWEQLQARLEKGNNCDYWIQKIERNRRRDLLVENQLNSMGWRVLRFWGKDIEKNTGECIKTIKEAIIETKIALN